MQGQIRQGQAGIKETCCWPGQGSFCAVSKLGERKHLSHPRAQKPAVGATSTSGCAGAGRVQYHELGRASPSCFRRCWPWKSRVGQGMQILARIRTVPCRHKTRHMLREGRKKPAVIAPPAHHPVSFFVSLIFFNLPLTTDGWIFFSLHKQKPTGTPTASCVYQMLLKQPKLPRRGCRRSPLPPLSTAPTRTQPRPRCPCFSGRAVASRGEAAGIPPRSAGTCIPTALKMRWKGECFRGGMATCRGRDDLGMRGKGTTAEQADRQKGVSKK